MQNVRAVSFRGNLLFALSRNGKPRPAPEAAATLDALRFLDIQIATIGNATELSALWGTNEFDAILPETATPADVPAALHLAPADVLHAGTSLKDDVNTALAAGMRAAWLAPTATFHPSGAATLLRNLSDLPNVLRMADTINQQHGKTPRISRDLLSLLREIPSDSLAVEPFHTAAASQIGDIVLEIASRLRAESTPLETLRSRWHELVPMPLLNTGSTPERVSPSGTLSVHCQNTIVREELHRWHSRRLLNLIPALPGCGSIKKINFHV